MPDRQDVAEARPAPAERRGPQARRSRSFRHRWNYWRRIFKSYFGRGHSQLSFWHEVPEVNDNFTPDRLGEYYQTFTSKADYEAHLDPAGVPQLDYHGVLGLQYNPIAIAQYGLGNYNLFVRTGDADRRTKFLVIADWLADNLEENDYGFKVWMHHFDWEYRDTLEAPWYSGLAQGQGISVLVRAHAETGDARYLQAATEAFECFHHLTEDGGVIHEDPDGTLWIEEYIVFPPTHILNGLMWATYGVWDYYLATGDERAKRIFDRSMDTLENNLARFDTGYWSLYEQSGTRLKMMASPFYHSLHIVELEILFRLTGRDFFRSYSSKWSDYRNSRIGKSRALAYKALFKFLYY